MSKLQANLQARVDVELYNKFIAVAEERGQTGSELLRDIARYFIETKEGKIKQAEHLEIKVQQLRREIEFIEENEAKKKKHMEEMEIIEEEKIRKQRELELERQEQVKIKEEVLKIWHGKGKTDDVTPDIRPKVEEKLAEWKAQQEKWNKPKTIGN